jgi:hypothetical protein
VHLTVASIMRNEADRFLPSWLDAVTQFADRIVVLDDGSTDGTAELLAGEQVEAYPDVGIMFGNEWTARRKLWQLATKGADWVLWLDADQLPSCDPRPFLRGAAAVFRVYDLWSDDTYREDAWWTGHQRCWWPAVHVPSLPDGFVDEWPERGWHSGHIPRNVPGPYNPVHECSILHWAYSSPELRAQKAAMYEALAPHLTEKERFHAKTITVPNPVTKRLPFEPRWRLQRPSVPVHGSN